MLILSLFNFPADAVDFEVYTVRVTDVSLERKFAENFLAHLESVVQEVEKVWQSMVIAVVTDASGECRKARRLFLQKYPWIVVLDCFSHQVSHSHHYYIYEY